MFSIVYDKKALKDIPKLKDAKLDKKVKNLIEILRENPFQTPPPYEKLQGDLLGAYSRRINIKHWFIYSEPYGLDNANKILIYLPWIRINDLPEGFVHWFDAFENVKSTEGKFLTYGIYNENAEKGFIAND